ILSIWAVWVKIQALHVSSQVVGLSSVALASPIFVKAIHVFKNVNAITSQCRRPNRSSTHPSSINNLSSNLYS
ncbi:hypothetical protein R3P38DRAFT_3148079, partial [Favolaschia claudopus]